MKIALLTDGIYPYVLGGMQRHSYYLCKYLLKAGVHVDLYHTLWEKSQDIEVLSVFTEEEKQNLRSFYIPWPKKMAFPGHYIRASYSYSKAVFKEFTRRSLDADFIYAKGFSAWKLLEEKKKGLYVAPLGLKLHGYEMYQQAPDFRTRQQHKMLRKPVKWNTLAADYVFSYGGKITEIIQNLGVETDKILEIPSGIEAAWLNEAPAQVSPPRKFIFLGRYERRKGVEELRNSLAKLLRMPQKFEFHFIGPIPDSIKIKHPAIMYHGKTLEAETIQNLLRAADVLVCPSYAEGMPNAILEAMASGLSVIATDVGAVTRLVDESNGQIIPIADTESLTEAMKQVLLMPDKILLQRKENSVQKIKDAFLWSEIIEKTLKKIKKINGTSVLIR